MINFKGLIAVTAMTCAVTSQALPILGAGSPDQDAALAGGTVIDFESVGHFYGASLTIDNVTFTGNGPMRVSSSYSGYYNTRGHANLSNLGSAPSQYRFDFAQAVGAFGFLFGASDVDWTLNAFGESGLLGSLIINPTRSSNAGDFFGLSANGINYATLTAGVSHDWIFIDNFTYAGVGENSVAVPEPGSLALLSLGALGLGAGRRKRTAC